MAILLHPVGFVSKKKQNITCMFVVLQEVQNKYTAVVKMIDSGDKLKLDQSHVETVIPAPGNTLLWLNVHTSPTDFLLLEIDLTINNNLTLSQVSKF